MFGSVALVPKIDDFFIKTPKSVSMRSIKIETPTSHVSNLDESEDSNSFEEFVLKEAVVTMNYESGDLMEYHTTAIADENRMQEELG